MLRLFFVMLLHLFVLIILILALKPAIMIVSGTEPLSNACPQLELPNGKVRIRSRGRIAKFSCHKPYVLVGDNVATCIQGEWNIPIPFCARTGCRKLDKLPNGETFSSYRGAVLKPICDHGFKLIGSPLLYCTGTSWNSSLPSCQAQSVDQFGTCHFEPHDDSQCQWFSKPSIYGWKVFQSTENNKSIGRNTHPTFDHTLAPHVGGYYLYLEANYPATLWTLRHVLLHGGVAHYISPLFPPLTELHTNSCIIFWYYMYGPHTGTIRVNVGDDTVWEKSRTDVNKWQKALITLQHQSEAFRIVIEGVGELGYPSNTAIDDLKVTTGLECDGQPDEVLDIPVEPEIQTTPRETGLHHGSTQKSQNAEENISTTVPTSITHTITEEMLGTTQAHNISVQIYNGNETLTTFNKEHSIEQHRSQNANNTFSTEKNTGVYENSTSFMYYASTSTKSALATVVSTILPADELTSNATDNSTIALVPVHEFTSLENGTSSTEESKSTFPSDFFGSTEEGSGLSKNVDVFSNAEGSSTVTTIPSQNVPLTSTEVTNMKKMLDLNEENISITSPSIAPTPAIGPVTTTIEDTTISTTDAFTTEISEEDTESFMSYFIHSMPSELEEKENEIADVLLGGFNDIISNEIPNAVSSLIPGLSHNMSSQKECPSSTEGHDALISSSPFSDILSNGADDNKISDLDTNGLMKRKLHKVVKPLRKMQALHKSSILPGNVRSSINDESPVTNNPVVSRSTLNTSTLRSSENTDHVGEENNEVVQFNSRNFSRVKEAEASTVSSVTHTNSITSLMPEVSSENHYALVSEREDDAGKTSTSYTDTEIIAGGKAPAKGNVNNPMLPYMAIISCTTVVLILSAILAKRAHEFIKAENYEIRFFTKDSSLEICSPKSVGYLELQNMKSQK